MAITDKIKIGIDIPRWQQLSPALNAHAAGGALCADKRNCVYSKDTVFQLASAAILNQISGVTGDSMFIANPGISAFGAGSEVKLVPSMSFVGSIGAGCSTTKVITTTTITSQAADSFVVGEVANEIMGAVLRVKGSSAGGSGKTEERLIISNTSGTTPTLYLDAPLSFTPANGDTYEIICGRIYCLGSGATGATQFRYNEYGTSNMVSCAGTGLTIATDSSMIVLDELFVPYDRKAGEGFLVGTGSYDSSTFIKNCLTATASAAGTITGQAASGDAAVLANEYRNFQIRIVEDTGTPTAVGQRRIIASHTAGASPVYTLGSNWTVTPSSTAKFVIENPNLIFLFTVAAGTATYVYNYTPYTINNGTTSIATNTWSSTYITARAAAVAAGCFTFPSYGHQPTTQADGSRNSRHSYIWSFRGGAITLDRLDIAGGTGGAWSNAIGYNAQQTAFTTGSGGDYAPIDNQGQWGYIILNTTGLAYRFNVKYAAMRPWPRTPVQSGTAAVGNRIAVSPYVASNGDRLSKVHVLGHLTTNVYRCETIV